MNKFHFFVGADYRRTIVVDNDATAKQLMQYVIEIALEESDVYILIGYPNRALKLVTIDQFLEASAEVLKLYDTTRKAEF